MRPFCFSDAFPAVFSRTNPGFDVVLGNPPYVDSEWMTVHRPATRAYCARRYAAASGNWDLFCVFIERSLQLLRVGGRHGFIVPNKLASAGYAAAARRLLAEDCHLLRIRDYSGVPVFSVSVYPLAYVVHKPSFGTPPPETVPVERMEARSTEPGSEATVAGVREVDYARGFARAGGTWPVLGPAGPVRVRSGDPGDGRTKALDDGPEGQREGLLDGLLGLLDRFPPLESVARVAGGATVSEAYELLPLLSNEEHPSPADLRVLNSGLIDPHRPLWGARPMRYLKHAFAHPVVEAARQQEIPPRRLQQARVPKVIVAGMTRVLECVADPGGEYLAAKSTTIVLPQDPGQVLYLAALLNSRLLTLLFGSLFGGLSLKGGYLRVAPPQIKRLPVPLFVALHRPDAAAAAAAVPAAAASIREQAKALHEVTEALARSASEGRDTDALARRHQTLRDRIDPLVCELYGLTPEQTRAVLTA
jgi:hypothetical protein